MGEIWVNSPSKAQGYWDRPEISEECFHATYSNANAAAAAAAATELTNGTPPSSSYLRTGDMGFIVKGELFICGRIKDLIIIRGANHYPQDIERTAENASSFLRAGCSGAFAVKHEAGHTETIVYVCEVFPILKYSYVLSSCLLESVYFIGLSNKIIQVVILIIRIFYTTILFHFIIMHNLTVFILVKAKCSSKRIQQNSFEYSYRY